MSNDDPVTTDEVLEELRDLASQYRALAALTQTRARRFSQVMADLDEYGVLLAVAQGAREAAGRIEATIEKGPPIRHAIVTTFARLRGHQKARR